MRIIFLSFLAFFLFACSTSKVTNEVGSQQLEKYINEKQFQIVVEWAYPQVTNSMTQLNNAGLFPAGSNASMINLQGNTSYLKLYSDKTEAYLPYFGERQMGSSYNQTDNAISFKGIPQNIKIEKTRKGNYLVIFKINDIKTPIENYNVRIELLPNLTSTITVNSSHRFIIRYKGRVEALNIKEDS